MIIEKTENGIYKMLDLSELPKKRWNGTITIDWKNINNHIIRFRHGSRRGIIKAVRSLPNKRVQIEFQGNERIVAQGSLREGKIIQIIENHGSFLYEKGELVNENLKIVERYKKHRDMKGVCYLVECTVSKNQWLTPQGNLKMGRKSPYTNWLKNESHVLPFLKNPEEAQYLSSFSSKSIAVICPFCQFEKSMIVANLTKQGFSCSYCSSTKVSFPERVFLNYLKYFSIEFEHQKRFQEGREYLYDFYLPALNSVVEVHGAQHYMETSGYFKNTLSKTQGIDKNKKEIILKMGKSYIEVDARYSEYRHLFKSINSIPSLPTISKEDMYKIMRTTERENFQKVENIVVEYLSKKKLKDIQIEHNITYGELISIVKRVGVYSPRNKKPNFIRVVNIKEKMIFASLTEAAEYYLVSSATIANWSKKKRNVMYYEDYVEKYGAEGLTEYVEEEAHN